MCITTEVTTNFFISPCTPKAYTFVLRPTAVSRFNEILQEGIQLLSDMKITFKYHCKEFEYVSEGTRKIGPLIRVLRREGGGQ